MSAFPPLKSHPSQPIPPSAALSLLETYITTASSNTAPHLLPNSTLTATGPTASDAFSNLTIHNLKRVAAGLRGEWLAPELELDSSANIGALGGSDPFAVGGDDGGQVSASEKGGMEGVKSEEWQDLEDYQREQSDIEGEIGERMNTAKNVEDVEGGEDAMEVDVPTKKLSKEEKKLAKKARAKEEQKARAKARQG